MAIKKFTINIPQEQIDDLQARLKDTLWPSTIDGNDYGGPSISTMQHLVKKAASYDWRKAEAELNKLPQFTTEIDGQNVHFIHVESKVADATPLMLIHGWPGSIVEFLDVIEPLTTPKNGEPAFHVVIPSLPGFGFSGPTHEQGWSHDRFCKALLELMNQLGYEKFVLQGGDAGAILAPDMARLAPEKVIALHINAATMGFMPFGEVAPEDIATFTDAEKERLQRVQDFMRVKFGFNLLQSNQPQLVAYAISDSPAGLMAWITQLMSPEQLEDKFLLNFMIYWFTGTAASSIRMYYEAAHDPNAWAPKSNSGVPTGVAVFQDEDIAIRKYGQDTNNIVRWTEYPEGGHYAVMRAEKVWLKDVREFFASVIK